MRVFLLVTLVLLAAGCRSSRLPSMPSTYMRAKALADRGRTGDALVLLQRADPGVSSAKALGPGAVPFFGCFGRWGRFRRLELRRELIQGPLELAPVLIELEPQPKPWETIRKRSPQRIRRR